jgi:hypothetical protein
MRAIVAESGKTVQISDVEPTSIRVTRRGCGAIHERGGKTTAGESVQTGYVIRCGNCGGSAPLVGELLGDLSEQVVTFQSAHAHAAGAFTVDCAVDLVDLEPKPEPNPERTSALVSA